MTWGLFLINCSKMFFVVDSTNLFLSVGLSHPTLIQFKLYLISCWSCQCEIQLLMVVQAVESSNLLSNSSIFSSTANLFDQTVAKLVWPPIPPCDVKYKTGLLGNSSYLKMLFMFLSSQQRRWRRWRRRLPAFFSRHERTAQFNVCVEWNVPSCFSESKKRLLIW